MRNVLTPIVAAAALAALAACGSDNTVQLADDASISQDVAASAGDAASTTVSDMAGSEGNVGLSSFVNPQGLNYSMVGPSFLENSTFSKTCYDATHTVVAGCSPMSSVRTIITQITHDRSRSGSSSVTGGATVSWTGAMHRSAYDSLSRVFNAASPPVETSRIHNDVGTEHDTTTFNNGTVSRTEIEAAHDSVSGLTFAIPRTAGELPSAGTITRIDSVHVVATKNGQSQTRDVVRVVKISFPADANGNITITVTGGVSKTCTYNLNTKTASCS